MEKTFGETLSNMRLIAEGAHTLFENDITSLYGFLMKNGKEEEALALDTIGAALTELTEHAHDLQHAYVAEFKVEK